jgi:ubiquinone/menaquinone biosynthesis C-methylase UbiE
MSRLKRSLVVFAMVLVSAPVIWALQLGSRAADEWATILERDERVEGLKIEEVVAGLQLKQGDKIADIGAGTGVFSRPLAKAIGSSGTLFAVEVDQELLDVISERAAKENIGNLQTVLGEFEDPKLPTNDLDVAFFHDVLHHIENRGEYLKATAAYLSPEGRIVVIDMIKGHPDAGHKDQPEMQISQADVEGWMKGAGLSLTEAVDLFDNKFFLVFGRR